MSNIHFDTLDLNLLKVLRAILEERSVTRAGARLGITQSAASHALNRLRAALDDQLVVRTPTGMHPTARGAEIAAALPAAFEHLRGALSAPVFSPQTSQRAFTIIAGPYACAVVLPGVVARVLREAPGVRVQIRPYTADMLGRLDRGEADLLIGRYGTGPAHMHQEPLFGERFVWVVRTRNPLARAPVTLAALASLRHVIIDNPQLVFDAHDPSRASPGIDDGVFQRELANQGLTQQVGLIVPDTMAALAVVSQTDMAALVPRRLALMRPPIGALKVIAPPYESPTLLLGFMMRPDLLETPDRAWLTARLRAVGAALD